MSVVITVFNQKGGVGKSNYILSSIFIKNE